VNFLADMGVQPATLQPTLSAATASADTVPPAVALTTVPAISTVGAAYTFSGTVTDAAGQVAGVEVSTDGQSWHPAVWQPGRGAWSYTYTPDRSGAANLRVRAVDDSLNLSAPVTATPTTSARTCPCGMWTDDDRPAELELSDGSTLELGVKWRADRSGHVRGVRFYKSSGNTGKHTGSLWSSTGQRLATGTFTNETASGWQTLLFGTPVEVAANTTYVVSYLTPTGRYSADTEYFSHFSRRRTYLEPLTALPSSVDSPNGVYRYGGGFPDRTSEDAHYWVDVMWAPTASG
jgi:hypothetical protein